MPSEITVVRGPVPPLWKTGSVPTSTRLPAVVFPPLVPMTTGAHVDSFEVNEEARVPQAGSPAMST